MTSKSQHIDRLYHREPSPAGPSRQSRLWALTLIVVLSAVLLTGCTKEKEKSGWDEIETYFDEPLASLSAEGDSVHWIGGEYGDLWSMTARGRKHYKLGSDRIYCVVRHDSTYWIGHRNGGLAQYRFDGSAFSPVAHYSIAIKGLHYSVYDIRWKAGRLYAATSQGLFVLNAAHHQLEKVYPRDRNNSASFATPLIANLDARRLALATDSGLALVDAHSGKAQVIHAGSKNEAKAFAKAVITSNKIKTELGLGNLHWGGIIAAMGRTGFEFDPNEVDISIESRAGRLALAKSGVNTGYSAKDEAIVLGESEVTITVDINNGASEAVAYGCDAVLPL